MIQNQEPVVLHDVQDGDERRVLSVAFDGRTVTLQGQDLGPRAPNGEYEYAYRFDADDKDALLLALLREKFAAPVQITAWLDANGVGYQFENFF